MYDMRKNNYEILIRHKPKSKSTDLGNIEFTFMLNIYNKFNPSYGLVIFTDSSDNRREYYSFHDTEDILKDATMLEGLHCLLIYRRVKNDRRIAYIVLHDIINCDRRYIKLPSHPDNMPYLLNEKSDIKGDRYLYVTYTNGDIYEIDTINNRINVAVRKHDIVCYDKRFGDTFDKYTKVDGGYIIFSNDGLYINDRLDIPLLIPYYRFGVNILDYSICIPHIFILHKPIIDSDHISLLVMHIRECRYVFTTMKLDPDKAVMLKRIDDIYKCVEICDKNKNTTYRILELPYCDNFKLKVVNTVMK